MAFKALKNHIGSLAGSIGSAVTDIAAGFQPKADQKSAGKLTANVLQKGPFSIPDSPAEMIRTDPLQKGYIQYPVDLGSEELGHYILFQSGFLKYQPQQAGMLGSMAKTSTVSKDNVGGSTDKITSKVPDGSITSQIIAIYMPPGVKVSYNQSYDADTESGIAGDFQAALDTARGAENTSQAIINAFDSFGGAVAKQAGQIVGEFVSMAGAGDPVRFGLKRAGLAINPRNEAFYNTPNQRTFSYTFDFWPRNETEAEAVSKIIHIFKYNSAPGLSEGGGFFHTPNYFKISYMFNNGPNPHLHKIGACFCTDVEVDYTPDGQVSTFANGQPVHTKLTVNFLEDRVLTKQDVGMKVGEGV